jgi:hypothetical protein
MPSENIQLIAGASRMHALYPTLFVRPGAQPPNTDIKTYDAGNFRIATQGIAANTATLGELRVRYSVVLSVPVLEPASSPPSIGSNYAMLQSIAAGETGQSTGVDYQPLMAQAQVGSLSLTNTAGTIVPVAGNYSYSWTIHAGCSGVTMDQIEGDLTYNGTPILVTTNRMGQAVNSASGSSNMSVSGTGLVSCDGTKALALVTNLTFSGGATTIFAVLKLQAI